VRHLLGIKQLSKENIFEILDLAKQMKERVIKGKEICRDLEGKTVTTLFYENSTRTKTSFDMAATLTGATVNSLDVASSSVQKGESLIDTGKTLDALCTDIVVIRHQASGAPLFLSKNVCSSVVNAGDGTHEHPTQALLDFMTMRERFGSFDGLKVAIIGDVKHSRVARSNLWGLKKLGAEVVMCGPKTLLPAELAEHCKLTTDPSEAVKGADVVMGLRIQLERQQQGLFPSLKEYNRVWGITDELVAKANPGAIVMHPGPVNRGVEINSVTADGERSVINEQVTNGLAVRMAVLSLIAKER
jgi:aspartate carbamoyltransferase catalytic subunit